MRKSLLLVVGAAVALTSACYRVTVVSGAPATAATPEVNVPWAHGFIYGLVPPGTVNTSAQCRQGVSRVVTQQSLINGLAQFLTWSLYSPQTITVQCASGPVRTGAVEAPAPQVAAVPAAQAPAAAAPAAAQR